MDKLKKEIGLLWEFYRNCENSVDDNGSHSEHKAHYENCHRLVVKKLSHYEQEYMLKIPIHHHANITKLKNIHKKFSKDYLSDTGYELAYTYGNFK
jgi:hypothetical protein